VLKLTLMLVLVTVTGLVLMVVLFLALVLFVMPVTLLGTQCCNAGACDDTCCYRWQRRF
jgi:hypothetical protein